MKIRLPANENPAMWSPVASFSAPEREVRIKHFDIGTIAGYTLAVYQLMVAQQF